MMPSMGPGQRYDSSWARSARASAPGHADGLAGGAASSRRRSAAVSLRSGGTRS